MHSPLPFTSWVPSCSLSPPHTFRTIHSHFVLPQHPHTYHTPPLLFTLSPFCFVSRSTPSPHHTPLLLPLPIAWLFLIVSSGPIVHRTKVTLCVDDAFEYFLGLVIHTLSRALHPTSYISLPSNRIVLVLRAYNVGLASGTYSERRRCNCDLRPAHGSIIDLARLPV